MKAIEKHEIVAALRAHLNAEIEASTKRAQQAAEAATHEENKPEGDKDMRSTEASYIARGQAERVHELEHALGRLVAMPLKTFGPGDSIEASALVEVEHAGPTPTKMVYFLVTGGGGIKLDVHGVHVHTLATTSPLGSALLGLSEGDEAEVTMHSGTRTHQILAVR